LHPFASIAQQRVYIRAIIREIRYPSADSIRSLVQFGVPAQSASAR
jgi:hypothetical protein